MIAGHPWCWACSTCQRSPTCTSVRLRPFLRAAGLRARWQSRPGEGRRLRPRAIAASGALAPGPSYGITAAKLEVGRVEGAGIPAFLTAGMNSSDQAPGELPGRHPSVRGNPGVLRCVLGFESGFSCSHRSTALH